MKKLIFALVLIFAFAGLAHATPTPVPPTPDNPPTLGPDFQGPIDPFPPPSTENFF